MLLLSFALADGFTVTPVAGVVTPDHVEPGLRLGWEMDPRLSLEAVGSMRMDEPNYGVGLGLSGRAWFAGVPGHGIYLQGRLVAGMRVEPEVTHPWGGLYGGFGARPRPWLGIEANMGPEYGYGLPVFRTELALTFVFGTGNRNAPGSGSVRHRPRPVP